MSVLEAKNRAPGFKKHPDYKLNISGPEITARATCGEHIIANTHRAILVSETDYADVVYFPRGDVDLSALEATDTSSFCPFKGTARYWTTASLPKTTLENIDICWSYEEPFDEVTAITSHIAFYKDRITVTYCQ